MASPQDDPNWDFQAGTLGRAALITHLVACLSVGLQKAAQTAANCDKLRLITQGLDENPAQFLARLTEALQKYTVLDSTSAEGTIVLNIHFISQSSPDIRKKLKKAKKALKPSTRPFKFSL